jgi:hypothetical protein
LLPVSSISIDQAADFERVLHKKSLVIKSEMNNPSADQNVSLNPKPLSILLKRISALFQLKNTLSGAFSYIQELFFSGDLLLALIFPCHNPFLDRRVPRSEDVSINYQEVN